MKTRSRPLYAYLFEAGVLNGTPEEIDRAKRAYRRLYKKRWKQNKKPRKEIRIGFTLKQFGAIKLKAREYNLTHTAYARSVILAAMELNPMITGRDQLLKILQLVGMAVIAMVKNTMPPWQVAELLEQAETILLQYIKN